MRTRYWMTVIVFTMISIASCNKNASIFQNEKDDPNGWIQLSSDLTPIDQIFALNDDYIAPVLIDCDDVLFDSNGCDIITESQISIIVHLVINRIGHIEKFRIIRKPEFIYDFNSPIAQAFSKWRFIPAKKNGKTIACYKYMALNKPLGRFKTEGCAKGE